ncbi:hypothetical protein [Candidatus Chlorohelix sp.]|uniref:hypothetical protein n=1 Tax=Candidatus Chlorohelix sp. TaxID=3139201 RepID=UPI003028D98C
MSNKRKMQEQSPQTAMNTNLTDIRLRLIVWTAGFIFFALFTPRMQDFLRPPTGDEPFYLITAQSILYDHDLDETNQFTTKSWLEFYPTCEEYLAGWKGFFPPGIPCSGLETLNPQNTTAKRAGIYTKHGLGLSFIIAPAYALGKRLGVMFLMNAIAATLALNIFMLSWEATRQRRIAWLCLGLLGLSAPLFSFAYLIFPQLPAALCVIYCYRQARLLAEGSKVSNLRLALAGICFGILPWLHYLYLLLSALLGLYLLWSLRKGGSGNISRRGYVALLLPVAFFGILFIGYFMYLYGTPFPNTADHDGFANPLTLPIGLLGLLFDQKYGLLMYSPVYLIPLAWLVKRGFSGNLPNKAEFYWLIAIILPYYILVADYNKWWGQWCPPARYLLPIVPLLALPMAQAFSALQGKLFKLFIVVSAGWGALITVAFVLNPRLSYHWEDTNPAKLLLGLEENIPFLKGVGLANFFPSYVNFIEPASPLYWISPFFWLGLTLWLGFRLVKTAQLKG